MEGASASRMTAEGEEHVAAEALPPGSEEAGTEMMAMTPWVEVTVAVTMTTWVGGVEVVARATGGEGEEAEAWAATEMDRHAGRQQTSENRQKRSVHSGRVSS